MTTAIDAGPSLFSADRPSSVLFTITYPNAGACLSLFSARTDQQVVCLLSFATRQSKVEGQKSGQGCGNRVILPLLPAPLGKHAAKRFVCCHLRPCRGVSGEDSLLPPTCQQVACFVSLCCSLGSGLLRPGNTAQSVETGQFLDRWLDFWPNSRPFSGIFERFSTVFAHQFDASIRAALGWCRLRRRQPKVESCHFDLQLSPFDPPDSPKRRISLTSAAHISSISASRI